MTQPKFVTLLSVLAPFALTALVACHHSAKVEKTYAVGASSKAGQLLMSNEWCTATTTDSANHFNTDHFQFHSDGTLKVISMQLQTDSTLVPTATSDGTWSVINDELFIMNAKNTLRSTMAVTTRDSDKVKCFSVAAGPNAVNLCACQD